MPGVVRSEGGHAAASTSRWRLVTSHGFDGAYHGSGFGLGVGVIAEKDGGMERGGEHRHTRHLSDLPSAASIGDFAGRRAVARTGPRAISALWPFKDGYVVARINLGSPPDTPPTTEPHDFAIGDPAADPFAFALIVSRN